MRNISVKSLVVFLLLTLLTTFIGFVLSFGLVTLRIFSQLNNTSYILGLIFIAGGIFSAISGNPVESSMQGLGQNNAQFLTLSNVNVKVKEEKLSHGLNIDFAKSSLIFVISGILLTIISKVFS